MDSNDILTSFQCVGMMPILSFLSTIAIPLKDMTACARLKPQRSLMSSDVVLECLFDDRNFLGKPIYGMMSSCSWVTSYWYLGEPYWLPFRCCVCIWYNTSHNSLCLLMSPINLIDTFGTQQLLHTCIYSLRYWFWVHFLHWHVCWILIWDWKFPYNVW